jgi:hypothetical protein
MKLTPELLAVVYDFLRRTPPFNRWAMPPTWKVQFAVLKDPHGNLFGDHQCDADGQTGHRIRVSAGKVGTIRTLTFVMAHEMIHVAQTMERTTTKGEHNRDFHRRKRQVARWHGYDAREL